MSIKYKVDDWLRLKGQSDRECVHVIAVREITYARDITELWYEVRLISFGSYKQSKIFMINEIEINTIIDEPKGN